MKFTDALDEYLKAKKEYDQARASYEGYDFQHHFYRQCKIFQDAKENLNSFFGEAK